MDNDDDGSDEANDDVSFLHCTEWGNRLSRCCGPALIPTLVGVCKTKLFFFSVACHTQFDQSELQTAMESILK